MAEVSLLLGLLAAVAAFADRLQSPYPILLVLGDAIGEEVLHRFKHNFDQEEKLAVR